MKYYLFLFAHIIVLLPCYLLFHLLERPAVCFSLIQVLTQLWIPPTYMLKALEPGLGCSAKGRNPTISHGPVCFCMLFQFLQVSIKKPLSRLPQCLCISPQDIWGLSILIHNEKVTSVLGQEVWYYCWWQILFVLYSKVLIHKVWNRTLEMDYLQWGWHWWQGPGVCLSGVPTAQ